MSRREVLMENFLKYEDETKHRVELGVELHRKGYEYFKVTDQNGNPLAGVKIHAKLKKHEFLHGANLFMLGEMETEEKNRKYEEYFKDCFNEATVPIYWNTLEPEDGKPRFSADSPKVYRRPATDLCVNFCEKYNITPKAHCLTYLDHDPKWVDEYDVNALRRRLDKRYKELAERYSEKIPAWEVANETVWGTPLRYKRPYYETDDFVDDSFRMAMRHFPYNELIINEGSHIWEPRINFSYNRSAYYQLVEGLMRRGAQIGAVGFQFHAFKPQANEAEFVPSLYNPFQIYKVLDKYAQLGKPMQITEITIPAFFETKEDYELQADIIERLYEIWFSHPAVEAAIYWNLPDGYAAWAPQGDMTAGENVYRGGLLDFNLNPKPAYERLKYLFHDKWTTDVTVETDARGEAKFLGFYGEYEAKIGTEEKKVILRSKNPVNITNVVL